MQNYRYKGIDHEIEKIIIDIHYSCGIDGN